MTCDNNRFLNGTIKNNLCTKYIENTSSFVKNKTGMIYNYTYNPVKKIIKGIYRDYDNSGYIQDISLFSPLKFYSDMENLINKEWVDDETYSVTVIFNLYSVNPDLFAIIRVLWENQGNYYKSFTALDFIDITPTQHPFYILIITCSLFNLGFIINNLKKPKIPENQKIKLDENNENKTLYDKICGLRIFSCISDNFRAPSFIQFISN